MADDDIVELMQDVGLRMSKWPMWRNESHLMRRGADEIEKLRTFFDAVQHNLDWQNNNDVVADYAAQCPDECAALDAALEVFTTCRSHKETD